MSDLPPLGDSGMNLPYEDNPERVELDEQMILSGGVVIAAATKEIDGHTYPAIMFRFALPHGEFLPPILLVSMPKELHDLCRLVRHATAAAMKAATAR